MVKIRTDVSYQEAGTMKARGTRQASETTRAIESSIREKLDNKDFGKDKGFLLELDSGEELKQVRPKIASVAKKLVVTIGTETREDERALWVWLEAEGRKPRQSRQSVDRRDDQSPYVEAAQHGAQASSRGRQRR